jgi:pimeloyl-ACP methyl ester carboxylesterase
VLLEAGIAASSLSWSLVQPELAKFARVCSYDRAGLAWSDPGGSTRSLAGFVVDLEQVLERDGSIPRCVLVGHSFGALVIRAFAEVHPREVAGLVFVDPLHPGEWCEPSKQQRRLLRGGIFLSQVGRVLATLGVVRLALSLLTGGAPGVSRRFSRAFGPTASSFLEHIVGEVRKLPANLLPVVQAHWSVSKAFRGMAQHLAALPVCSRDVMKGNRMSGDTPIVVISASTRSSRWLAADAALARMSRSGRHLVSKHAGHWILLDDPQLVVNAVRQVLTRT